MADLRKLLPRFSLRTLVIFLLLVTAGMGLWWRWEPWAYEEDFEIEGTVFSAEFLPGDQFIKLRHGWVLLTAPQVPTLNGETAESVPSYPKGRHLYEKTSIHRMPNGEVLSSTNWSTNEVGEEGTYAAPQMVSCISVNGRRLAACRRTVKKRPSPAPQVVGKPQTGAVSLEAAIQRIMRLNTSRVEIFHRRRPEWWWGVFWLWEFWLTAAFAGLFIWSVVRDRRRLARTG